MFQMSRGCHSIWGHFHLCPIIPDNVPPRRCHILRENKKWVVIFGRDYNFTGNCLVLLNSNFHMLSVYHWTSRKNWETGKKYYKSVLSAPCLVFTSPPPPGPPRWSRNAPLPFLENKTKYVLSWNISGSSADQYWWCAPQADSAPPLSWCWRDEARGSDKTALL